LPEDWKVSIMVPIYKPGDKTYCSNYTYTSTVKCVQNFIHHPAVKINSI